MAYDERKLGHHEEYEHAIDVRAFSSRGISYRLRGWQSGKRDVHLLSTPERDFFYCLEADPSVYDIREQFPLNPAFTTQIAKQWKLKHPIDRKTGDPFQMTTDFLVTRRDKNNELFDTAYSVKTLEELFRTPEPNSLTELRRKMYEARRNSPRKPHPKRLAPKRIVTVSCDHMWQRIRIEQKYWARRDICFQLISDGDIDYTLAWNIGILQKFYFAKSLFPLNDNEIETLFAFMNERVGRTDAPLIEIGQEADRVLGHPPGMAMCAAKHFIASRRWSIDLTIAFSPDQPLKLL